MRAQGSIAEPALIGEKDRRAEFAMVVDRAASKPGNLLVARVKITSYNHPAAAGSAPLFRTPVVSATKSTRRKEPTTSSNQPVSLS